MKSKQVDTKPTKLVRIDAGWHQQLKIKAAERQTTIRSLIEDSLADLLEAKGGYLLHHK